MYLREKKFCILILFVLRCVPMVQITTTKIRLPKSVFIQVMVWRWFDYKPSRELMMIGLTDTHHSVVTMSVMASQITSNAMVYSIIYLS